MSAIFKKHLSRRTFVQGMGATIALPLLDAMVPAQTPLVRTAAQPPVRLGLCFIPHGAVMNQWTPSTVGAPLSGLPQWSYVRARAAIHQACLEIRYNVSGGD